MEIEDFYKDITKVLNVQKDLVPCGFNARIKKIQIKHYQQATQLQQAMQEQKKQIRAIMRT